MHHLEDKRILITGGTGSFGRTAIHILLELTQKSDIVVFSRDELKQWELQREFNDPERLRFFLGDVRDAERLYRAFDGVDVVIHAAALKQVPAAEYNPFEAVKTNVLGAKNIIDAAIDRNVERVIALSSDKASSPVNLYGATKLLNDKLFVAGNAYAGQHRTRFAVVRYGNVLGSRGSVVPLFQEQAKSGVVTLTDDRMTRFWITLPQAVDFVLRMLDIMVGGEVFVPKIPSMKIIDVARAIAPGCGVETIGIRPGEKLHEEMISESDSRNAIDTGDFYIVQPAFEWWPSRNPHAGITLPDGFRYASDINDHWLTEAQLREMVDDETPGEASSLQSSAA